MKKTTLTLLLSLFAFVAFAQEEEGLQTQIDSIEKTFTYQHGTIELQNGVGKIIIPKGFKYLDSKQAERVLVDLWGNPKSENMSMGLILPESEGVMSEKGYVFNIQYDEIGYVKDDDADDIDYEELLAEMQKESEAENEARKKEGYEAVTIVGWAAKPFYDKDKKILHWAKELKFGNAEVNTLNYNIRILGRKGVLVLNAIATTKELPLVQKDINKVLGMVQFNDGYKYEQFDSSVDDVAAWTIGGLVAGKVLTKVGFFAIIAKFGKLIFIGLLGLFAAFRKKISGLFSKNKNEEEDQSDSEPEVAEAIEPHNESPTEDKE